MSVTQQTGATKFTGDSDSSEPKVKTQYNRNNDLFGDVSKLESELFGEKQVGRTDDNTVQNKIDSLKASHLNGDDRTVTAESDANTVTNIDDPLHTLPASEVMKLSHMTFKQRLELIRANTIR